MALCVLKGAIRFVFVVPRYVDFAIVTHNGT
jgi:hypothetical protein